MAAAISALVSLAIAILVQAAAKVWGWRAIGLGALVALAAVLAIRLIASWREQRAREERGGPIGRTARLWEREHVNGRRSWVQEMSYRKGHYWIGVIVLGFTASLPQGTVGTLEEVQRQADAMSECSQPCRCPSWASVRRPNPK